MMPTSPNGPTEIDLPALFRQLRSRYDNAGLTTELLHIEAGEYIVRAVVRQDNHPIATAIAAAMTIEEAEELAQIRVLTLVGLLTFRPEVAGVTPLSTPTPTWPSAPPTPLATPSNFQEKSPRKATLPVAQPKEPRTRQTSSRPSSEDAEPHFISTEPEATEANDSLDDWSDELAQIDLEIRRLGWTRSQEEDYLREQFRLPSRDYITDYDELLSFLEALRSLPATPRSPIETWKPDAVATPQLPPITANSHVQPSETSTRTIRSEMMETVMAECKRLGWKPRQGSEYLQQMYGKQTRRELTDQELQEFLTYLQAQGSPSEKAPF